MAGGIFINYRRGDDPGTTGRLFDRLSDAFRPEQLFMDVDSIPVGVDFVRLLQEKVAECDVFLAIIGKGWAEARDAGGARRLDNPEDPVRIEIESALKQDKRIIPVLVQDARMPRPDELPDAISALARRHAVRLTHERFRADAQGLVKTIQQALEEASTARQEAGAKNYAMRYSAPLLLVFVILGILTGGFLVVGTPELLDNNITTMYRVGSVALALIVFDGGLRIRFATFRNVLGPAVTLATVGVLLTAAFTAPVAYLVFDLRWIEALLVGAVVASTDAAAVFFLMHGHGSRLRAGVGSALEVESASSSPLAILLTILLVDFAIEGDSSWQHVLAVNSEKAILGIVIGIAGGFLVVTVLNRIAFAQGLHAPFVVTSAILIFLANVGHGSGFLAVYLAGLVVGNRPTRAYNTVVAFHDAVTWLAQIVMCVMLGLVAWESRLMDSGWQALAVAATLMLVARPLAIFLCLMWFRFSWREKAFISWVGLRGSVTIFLSLIPFLVGLPRAGLYFAVAFVVVIASLLIQSWTIGLAARRLDVLAG